MHKLRNVDFGRNKNIADFFGNSAPDEIIKLFERINGILLSKNLKERKAFAVEKEQRITSFLTEIELVFPDKEERKKIFTEMIIAFSKQLRNKKITNENVSFFVFNLITYLHPFEDGNGRTARTLLFLLKDTNSTNEYEDVLVLKRFIAERNDQDVGEYHHQINTFIPKVMLWKRGWRKKEIIFNLELADKQVFPTTETHDLYFIALYDSMTAEERLTLNKGEGDSILFIEKDIPEDIILRASKKMESVRSEFLKEVLKMSLNIEQDVPAWLMEMFKKITN